LGRHTPVSHFISSRPPRLFDLAGLPQARQHKRVIDELIERIEGLIGPKELMGRLTNVLENQGPSLIAAALNTRK
jgi:hypothetical protein